jgi:hypothetical protein
MRPLRDAAVLVLGLIPAASCGARSGLLGDVVLDASAGGGEDASASGDGAATHTLDAAAEAGPADAAHDVRPAHDGAPVDAAHDGGPDARAPASCDGGYFVVANVAGRPFSQVLRGGCGRASVPTLSGALCGEDCQCSDLAACSDAAALDLTFAAAPGVCEVVQEAGIYNVDRASWTSGGTTEVTANGWIEFSTFDPGSRQGKYALTFGAADGGDGDLVAGTFCVQ